jgi:hypothetical protein
VSLGVFSHRSWALFPWKRGRQQLPTHVLKTYILIGQAEGRRQTFCLGKEVVPSTLPGLAGDPQSKFNTGGFQ